MTKTFTYQFDIDAEPYNEDTAKTQFNPDFPEDVLAKDLASQLIQDAIGFVSFLKRKFLSTTSGEESDLIDKTFWNYLNEKEQRYIKAQESLRLSEKTKN
jgi:hypothetical protein